MILTVRVGDDLSVLHVEPMDALERARVGAVIRDELCNDGHWLGGVHGLTGTVKLLVSHPEAIEVTAICQELSEHSN